MPRDLEIEAKMKKVKEVVAGIGTKVHDKRRVVKLPKIESN